MEDITTSLIIRHVPEVSLTSVIAGSTGFSFLLSDRRCFSRIIDSIAFVFLIDKKVVFFSCKFLGVCNPSQSRHSLYEFKLSKYEFKLSKYEFKLSNRSFFMHALTFVQFPQRIHFDQLCAKVCVCSFHLLELWIRRINSKEMRGIES